jgi:hypothetical protein
LVFSLGEIVLVDADGIDPDYSLATPGAHKFEHGPAVFGLQQNIPVRSNEYWFAG